MSASRCADVTEVIGAALLAKASGRGWRAIAAEVGRAPSTVRRWLRRAGGDHPAWPRQHGVAYAAQLAPDVLNELDVQPTRLGDALAALAAAVAAWRRYFTCHVHAWTLIGVITAGRLLATDTPSG